MLAEFAPVHGVHRLEGYKPDEQSHEDCESDDGRNPYRHEN